MKRRTLKKRAARFARHIRMHKKRLCDRHDSYREVLHAWWLLAHAAAVRMATEALQSGDGTPADFQVLIEARMRKCGYWDESELSLVEVSEVANV